MVQARLAGVPYPLRPMVATPARELPVGPLGYEPKWDGFRALGYHTGERVVLQSRQLRPLTRYFPEVAAALAELHAASAVLDGEIVLWRNGKLDFTALQRRLHPAEGRARQLAEQLPASYVVFDLLALDGEDLRRRPYWGRRQLLEALLGRYLPTGLVLTPATTDPTVARAWLTGHTDAGIEGVVTKRLTGRYRSGSGWTKTKARLTAEAVIGGVLGPLEEPRALVLGRPDARGRLRVAGRTSPLPREIRAELAELLMPADRAHPWPEVISSSRFGQLPPEPVEYVRVAPSLVVELDVDTAHEVGRWRHPARLVRLRPDLQPADLQPV